VTVPKVGIVVPSGDMVHAKFAVCLTGVVQATQRADMVVINPQSSLVATGRQMGVEAALGRECSHILFLDSDMVFPPDTLEILLSHDKPVVGATYVRRKLPSALLHRELVGEARVGHGLREVARLPLGCTLIQAEVFEELAVPYFRCTYPNGFEAGEDFWFCDQAREKSFGIWLDANLSRRIGHLGMYTHTVNDLGESLQ
jgi:hypothetical protein